MINEEKKTFLNSMSRTQQVLFIGFLCGALFFGFYLVIMGVLPMFEKPTVLSSDKFGTTYPLSFQHNYYSSRSEIEVYNDDEWNAERVWIGSKLEYQAYRNGSLMTSDQHVFRGPFVAPKSFDYKYRYGFETLIDPDYDTVIEVNGLKNMTKVYSVSATGVGEKTVISVKEIL